MTHEAAWHLAAIAVAGFAMSCAWMAVLLKRAAQQAISELLNGVAEAVR